MVGNEAKRVAACMVAAAMLIPCAFALADDAPALVDGAQYLGPQALVEVEPGRRLNLYCVGSGEPVVVLEAGLTDPINVWGLVQPRVSAHTRLCAYDRAGIGFSDEQTRPSTSANMVDDLHRLLAAAGIRTPVVLVGHSAGGMHVRLFAYTYPHAVAGLVLVDPSHEDQTEGFRRLDPERRSVAEWDEQVLQPALIRRRACIESARAGIIRGSAAHEECGFPQYAQLSGAVQRATEGFQLSYAFQRAQLSEEESVFHASADQLRAARRQLRDLPTIVLTKDRPPPPAKALTADETKRRAARYELWVRLGAQSAATSSIGIQRIVAGAGHGMPLEHPRVVADAVGEVLAAARRRPARTAAERAPDTPK